MPGSHLRQLLQPDGTAPTESPLPGGRCQEIEESYARGDFRPVVLKAGSIVFRVPCVWHAVRPVHRLRRYVTGRYFVRVPAARIDGANGGIQQTIEARSAPEALEIAAHLPSALRALLDPSDVFVQADGWNVGQLCEVQDADGGWHLGKINEKIVSVDQQQNWIVSYIGQDGHIEACDADLRAPADAKL